jgi:hypothetical protein
MSKTKREVIHEALRHMGVIDHGDAAPADEYERCSKHYDTILDQLDELHEVAISFTADAVPEWAFTPLALMVAGSVCTGFEYQRGLRDFRRYAALEAHVEGRSVETVYF